MAIHVLGYSFGGIVALDVLCPGEGSATSQRLSRVRSPVTVGCPADFVRLYYPEYFRGRRQMVEVATWTNLFIPADVLGSNFIDSAETMAPVAAE